MRFHGQAIGLLIALDPGAPDRRAFGGVQQPELDAGLVGQEAHDAPQGIDFFDQMTFGQPAHRRVAGHVGHGVQVEIEQQDVQAHAGCGQGTFAAGMAAADDNEIVGLRIDGHNWLIIRLLKLRVAVEPRAETRTSGGALRWKRGRNRARRCG